VKYRHYFFDFDAVFRNGPPIDEITRQLFGDEATTPELISRMRALFRRHYDEGGFPNTRPYPGIEGWLARIQAEGANAYIVTNKRYCATNLLVDKLGWRQYFKTVYSSDMFMDTPIGKLRKPALLAEALRRENASPADSVMVGDSANDFVAARENGMHSIGCTWGYGAPGDMDLADETIDGPDASSRDAGGFYRRAASVLEVAAVGPDTRFRELDGWCSLKAFGLLTMLDNDFGVMVPIGEFTRYSTLGELEALAGGRR